MLYVEEDYVNRTEGYRCGSSGIQEAFTDDPGELFRRLQQEYGRCTSHVFVDGPAGAKKIGWVFVKREKYEDSPGMYLQEVWVTLHDAQPIVTTRYHHHELRA